MKITSTIWKSTFREIKQSMGRFLAIVAIVALGVGFFSGLKVTQPAMIKTTQKYLDEHNFFDYHILSTVGFSDEDVAAFAAQEDVRAAEGTIAFDILCGVSGGNEVALKALGIPEKVNGIVLVEGRLPEQENECVVDANLYGDSVIGKKLIISEENTDSDLDHFAYREYTITGRVQSPLYIQFERGTTSLGSGQLSGFFYLKPDGFELDGYTDVYVKFDQDFPMYADAYDDYMDEKTDVWETLADERAKARYQTVTSEAKEKLADAKKQLSENQAEAEEKLADAKQQLADAKAKLEDGEQQLKKAKEEIEQAPEELEQKEQQLQEAETELKQKEAELDQGEIALGLGYAMGMDALSKGLNSAGNLFGGDAEGTDADSTQMDLGSMGDSLSQVQDAKQQIADGKEQIAAGKQQIADGKAAIAAAKKELAQGKKELAEKEKELEDGRAEYEKGEQEYRKAKEEFDTQIADAKQQIAEGEKQLADLKDAKSYVLGRGTNVGYVCFESDSGIVDGVANVFPIFFFLVAALVCMTTMNRMVEEQRVQIGVWKALGYSEKSIMGKYLFYSGTAAMIGCTGGFIGGTILFPKVIWYAYGMMYRVDSLCYVFDGRLAGIALIGGLLCSVGTTYVTCRYELKEMAAQLMRPKAPKAGKRVFLEYLPFLWKRLKFLQKVSLRNIFRYKKRFFMMIVGISGCSALLVTGFGVRDSVTNVASQQYHEIKTYDISVTCQNAVDDAMRRELDAAMPQEIAAYTAVMQEAVDLEADGTQKSIYLVAADGEHALEPFLNLHTTKKEPVAYPGVGEAVISHKIAQQYDIRVGDTIELTEDDQTKIEVKVSGIFQNFVYNYVYLTAETYEKETGKEAEYQTLYVNGAEGEDMHLLGTTLANLDNVAAVSVNEDFLARFSSMMKSMDLIVLVIIICAAGLAFIVLYNLTNINITERVREIATIKVLGFFENETSAYVFRENLLLTFLGALVGLALGYFLHRFVMGQINIDMVAFDVHVQLASYCYSLLLTMVFALFVNQMMKRKIDKISMTESLKSVD